MDLHNYRKMDDGIMGTFWLHQ